jgi:3-dehydroquinate synthase
VPPASETIEVRLSDRSYTIEIGAGLVGSLGAFVVARRKPEHVIVITDENVEDPHARAAAESLADADMAVDVLVIEAGEESKSIEMADGLWRQLLDLKTDRKTAIVAVGGGVVGDLAGFVAATYARGLDFFQVPTTLLAQVDSSVGGKVGVNLPDAKNMVGVFWQPRGVLIDTDVLATLGDREYRAGLAEVIKYGVILDADFFAYLEANRAGLIARDTSVLRHVIARSCRLKADVVEKDEREESGLRAVLNYGHTFCHALEAVTGYGQLLHGEAVSIGMLCASRLAERLGRIDASMTQRQRELLAGVGLPVDLPEVDRPALLAAMRHDKKTERGNLRFVLPTRMGHVETVAGVPEADVLAAMG